MDARRLRRQGETEQPASRFLRVDARALQSSSIDIDDILTQALASVVENQGPAYTRARLTVLRARATPLDLSSATHLCRGTSAPRREPAGRDALDARATKALTAAKSWEVSDVDSPTRAARSTVDAVRADRASSTTRPTLTQTRPAGKTQTTKSQDGKVHSHRRRRNDRRQARARRARSQDARRRLHGARGRPRCRSQGCGRHRARERLRFHGHRP